MALFVKFLALFCIANVRLGSSAPMMTQSATMNYLTKYGYMEGESTKMAQGLKKFQKMMNMEPNGEMDQKTSDAMHAPRCGMADMSGDKLIKARGWKKNQLTYNIKNYPDPTLSHISPINIRVAIKEAFELWSTVADLKFTVENKTAADIDISFAKGWHQAHHDIMDGPWPKGVELAHAGVPTHRDEAFLGDVHFDDDEKWVINPSQPKFSGGHMDIEWSGLEAELCHESEFNFFYVAVHEIGHALGLTHTSMDKHAIMGPSYRNTTEVQLGANDVKRIQWLYGVPKSNTLPKSRFLDTEICEDPKIDAAFSVVDGSTYIVKEKQFWKLTGTGLVKSGYPMEVNRMWPNAPDRIDAAFTNIEKRLTFFFKDSHVARYDSFRPDKMGSMKTWFDLDLDSVDAIMKGGDKQPTYFFKGNMFHKKIGKKLFTSGLIKDEFKGVPDDLDAAVVYKRKDNQPADPVFFKGNKCYYRRFLTSSTPGKAGQFTDEFVEVDTRILFGCSS